MARRKAPQKSQPLAQETSPAALVGAMLREQR